MMSDTALADIEATLNAYVQSPERLFEVLASLRGKSAKERYGSQQLDDEALATFWGIAEQVLNDTGEQLRSKWIRKTVRDSNPASAP